MRRIIQQYLVSHRNRHLPADLQAGREVAVVRPGLATPAVPIAIVRMSPSQKPRQRRRPSQCSSHAPSSRESTYARSPPLEKRATIHDVICEQVHLYVPTCGVPQFPPDATTGGKLQLECRPCLLASSIGGRAAAGRRIPPRSFLLVSSSKYTNKYYSENMCTPQQRSFT